MYQIALNLIVVKQYVLRNTKYCISSLRCYLTATLVITYGLLQYVIFITDYGLVQSSSTLPAKYRDHLEIFSDTILQIEKFNNAFNSAELTGDDLVSLRNIAKVFSDSNNLVILNSSIKYYKLQDVIHTFVGNVSTMIKIGLAPKGVGIHYSYDGGFTFVRM